MTVGDAMLRGILERPDDDTARLVYADWLQENGNEPRAELIRVQIEIARIDGDPSVPHPLDNMAMLERKRHLRKREGALTHVITGPLFGRDGGMLPPGLQYAVHHGVHGAEDIFGTGFGCRRGFPFRWRCGLREFLRDAQVAFSALPIETVELLDMRPTPIAAEDERVEWTYFIGTVNSGYHLPQEIYYQLDRFRDWRLSRATALEFLSHACVTYGRDLAGLPPLT